MPDYRLPKKTRTKAFARSPSLRLAVSEKRVPHPGSPKGYPTGTGNVFYLPGAEVDFHSTGFSTFRREIDIDVKKNPIKMGLMAIDSLGRNQELDRPRRRAHRFQGSTNVEVGPRLSTLRLKAAHRDGLPPKKTQDIDSFNANDSTNVMNRCPIATFPGGVRLFPDGAGRRLGEFRLPSFRILRIEEFERTVGVPVF